MPKLTGFAPAPIPGPKALPFIGVQVNAVRLVADPIGRCIALHREHGDIVAAADNNPALVLAFGAEHNREVLSNVGTFDNDVELFMKVAPDSALAKLSKGLVFQAGGAHRRHRRLLMPAFHKGVIDGYAPDIVRVAESALRSWPIGQTADVADLTRTLVRYVAVRCLFGLDWEKGGDRGLGRAAAETNDLVTSPLAVALPIDLPGTPFARLTAVSEELVGLLRALIEEKRRESYDGGDVLALMVKARDEDDSRLTDDELIGEAVTLFVAGYDTQARTLAWTLFLLGQHPAVLGDVLDEIDAVLRGGPPTLADVPKLVLVDRVIKESMRVLAPVPISFVKVCQSEARLGPYTLPRGANVVLSPFITHRDPELYPEPARFVPRRWERLTVTPYEYAPFGAGPRMCIGWGFATLAMRLVLPMILQRYRLTLAYGARVSRLVRSNILAPRYGLPMLIAPQDRHFVRREHVRGDIPELLDLS